jgi:IS5 family transposase
MERELWLQLYRIVVSLDRFDWRGRYRASDILLVFLWAVVHDRPTIWACQAKNWSTVPRHLPTQPTMSRRLRSSVVQQLLSAVEAKLGADAHGWWVCRIDSKPLVVGCYSKDRDAKWGRAGSGYARGYKLHLVLGPGRVPVRWCIASMNEGDARVALRLIDALPGGGYLVGDKQYDSNPLHAHAAVRGFQIVAQQKRASQQLGHRPHHPARLRSLDLVQTPFGRALLEFRGSIERHLGTLTCSSAGLGPLPAWVRWPHRVYLWVQAKLILYAVRSQQFPTPPAPATA